MIPDVFECRVKRAVDRTASPPRKTVEWTYFIRFDQVGDVTLDPDGDLIVSRVGVCAEEESTKVPKDQAGAFLAAWQGYMMRISPRLHVHEAVLAVWETLEEWREAVHDEETEGPYHPMTKKLMDAMDSVPVEFPPRGARIKKPEPVSKGIRIEVVRRKGHVRSGENFREKVLASTWHSGVGDLLTLRMGPHGETIKIEQGERAVVGMDGNIVSVREGPFILRSVDVPLGGGKSVVWDLAEEGGES